MKYINIPVRPLTHGNVKNNWLIKTERDFQEICIIKATIQNRLTFGTLMDNYQFADKPTTVSLLVHVVRNTVTHRVEATDLIKLLYCPSILAVYDFL